VLTKAHNRDGAHVKAEPLDAKLARLEKMRDRVEAELAEWRQRRIRQLINDDNDGAAETQRELSRLTDEAESLHAAVLEVSTALAEATRAESEYQRLTNELAYAEREHGRLVASAAAIEALATHVIPLLDQYSAAKTEVTKRLWSYHEAQRIVYFRERQPRLIADQAARIADLKTEIAAIRIPDGGSE